MGKNHVETLQWQIRIDGAISPPTHEYRFAPIVDGKHVRLWRFDLAWPDKMFACEVDGGMFTGGRHGGSPSAVRDLEKRAIATCLGWRVLHVTPTDVRSGRALTLLRACFGLDPIPF